MGVIEVTIVKQLQEVMQLDIETTATLRLAACFAGALSNREFPLCVCLRWATRELQQDNHGCCCREGTPSDTYR